MLWLFYRRSKTTERQRLSEVMSNFHIPKLNLEHVLQDTGRQEHRSRSENIRTHKEDTRIVIRNKNRLIKTSTTGRQVFTCDWCDCRYLDRTGLYRHKLRMHPNRIPPAKGSERQSSTAAHMPSSSKISGEHLKSCNGGKAAEVQGNKETVSSVGTELLPVTSKWTIDK